MNGENSQPLQLISQWYEIETLCSVQKRRASLSWVFTNLNHARLLLPLPRR